MSARRPDDGFTLPELLVAITILGIIMIAIGAMITTSFHTSRTVGQQLQGSRAPKMTSRYWIPDVEQAKGTGVPSCPIPGNAIVTFTSQAAPSAFTTPADTSDGLDRTITWSIDTNGRIQLKRTVCDPNTPPETTVVVSELASHGTTVANPKPGRYVLTVTVPDRSERSDGTYNFKIEGTSQVTITVST